MTFKVDGWVRKIQVDVELHRTVTSNSNSKKKKKFKLEIIANYTGIIIMTLIVYEPG